MDGRQLDRAVVHEVGVAAEAGALPALWPDEGTVIGESRPHARVRPLEGGAGEWLGLVAPVVDHLRVPAQEHLAALPDERAVVAEDYTLAPFPRAAGVAGDDGAGVGPDAGEGARG